MERGVIITGFFGPGRFVEYMGRKDRGFYIGNLL